MLLQWQLGLATAEEALTLAKGAVQRSAHGHVVLVGVAGEVDHAGGGGIAHRSRVHYRNVPRAHRSAQSVRALMQLSLAILAGIWSSVKHAVMDLQGTLLLALRAEVWL